VATSWCRENGAESVDDIVCDDEIVEQFLEAMKLKNIPKTKLRNKLKARMSMAL